jgi:hypothetical protein
MSDDQVSLLPDPSTTEMLAEGLDLTVEQFVEVFGSGWRPLPDQGNYLDSDPEGWGNLFDPWYVAGEPFQLTLRPHPGWMELGVPVGKWAGAHGLYWESHDRRDVHGTGPEVLERAQPVVGELLKRRRSKFRYCRYCFSLVPPEERLEPTVCYGCGTTWRGVIY